MTKILLRLMVYKYFKRIKRDRKLDSYRLCDLFDEWGIDDYKIAIQKYKKSNEGLQSICTMQNYLLNELLAATSSQNHTINVLNSNLKAYKRR